MRIKHRSAGRPERLVRETRKVPAVCDIGGIEVPLDRRERLLDLGGAEATNVEAQSTRDEESGGAVESVVMIPRSGVDLGSFKGYKALHDRTDPRGEGCTGENCVEGDAIRVF